MPRRFKPPWTAERIPCGYVVGAWLNTEVDTLQSDCASDYQSDAKNLHRDQRLLKDRPTDNGDQRDAHASPDRIYHTHG